MPGTNAETGKELTGLAHLRQSVRDILTTPIGTRVMRRDYGSRLMELVDSPLTPATLTDIYAAANEALARWEPRLRVERIKVSAADEGKTPAPGSAASGQVLIDLAGVYLPTGPFSSQPVRLEGIVVSG